MIRYFDTGLNGATDALGRWLDTELVPGIRSFRGQFGFFDAGALRPFLPALQGVVEGGGTVRLVIGANVGDPPTTNDLAVILPLVGPADRTSLTVVGLAGALFHPKTMHIVRADGRPVGVVSSANFTRKGLGHSVEAGVLVEAAPSTAASLEQIAAAIDRWATLGEAGVYQVRTAEDIELLRTLGLAVSPEARHTIRARQRAGTTATGRGTRPVGWRPAAAAGATPDDEAEETEEAVEAVEAVEAAAVDGGVHEPDTTGPRLAAPAGFTNFAMVLAQFDVSHRTGVPGTPEMSLPGDVEPFFGPLGFGSKNRKHAGRHFFVEIERPQGVLNDEYRAWRREAGEGGNADFRLRVSHELVDMTDPSGGDILHVQRRPGTNPEYHVRIVKPTSPDFAGLAARCTRAGGTGGAAGHKRYGLW